ncbi:hypothetical protein BV898_13177 [Hypsibius exemplaris]|uniref:Uncharacterized protein n=1 Tax=Hypsibius exemplaris TaxID=2072580 RepID=A0A1W0WBJ7_HYPEX|nr:hypothetical protein BV898_13177 [Hypsibius exemplaris]
MGEKTNRRQFITLMMTQMNPHYPHGPSSQVIVRIVWSSLHASMVILLFAVLSKAPYLLHVEPWVASPTVVRLFLTGLSALPDGITPTPGIDDVSPPRNNIGKDRIADKQPCEGYVRRHDSHDILVQRKYQGKLTIRRGSHHGLHLIDDEQGKVPNLMVQQSK